MRKMLGYTTAALVLVLGGAGTEKAWAGLKERENPIVRAVRKTRDSVVTVKVVKRGKYIRKEITGTGVVIDEKGYVVTNHHVISNGEGIRVFLFDGTEMEGTVLLDRPEYDLAVLRLSGVGTKKLKALRFAPTHDLMVGEYVIAIGHPFGYHHTVSRGIISALGRKIEMAGHTLTGLIQTDASINPGNSGGPLLNIDGEMIGINVALREGAQGIAFALDANKVQSILSEALAAHRIAHVKHGLVCKEAPKLEADEDGPRQLVVVEGVAAKSPAARAGLRQDDVILRLGDKAVSNRFDLERALWRYRGGDRVEAHIIRDGKIRQVSLTLDE